MAISNSGRGLITLLLVCGLLHCAAGETIYTVGGDVGWTAQSLNSTFYQDWANNITLFVGDALNFTLGADHDVVMIPVANLAACDNSSFIIRTINASGDWSTIGLNTGPGTYGFISDIGNDCTQYGMHFSATWNPPPSPSPAGSPAQTPAQNLAETPAETPDEAPAPTSG